MIAAIKKVVDTMDNTSFGPEGDNSCVLTGNCKMHVSPGDIIRYSGAVLLALFGLLLIVSLFFPNLITSPNMRVLNDLIDVVHRIFGSSPIVKPN